MKKPTLFLLIISTTLFITGLTANAQNTPLVLSEAESDTLVFQQVEKMPKFKGGMEKYVRFIGHTVRYPAKSRIDNTQGKVILQFIVEKDGSLSNIKVIKSVSLELDAEALRVMRLSPKWEPGYQNGRVVRVSTIMPVGFALAQY